MAAYVGVNDVVMLTEENLHCEFRRKDGTDFFFEAVEPWGTRKSEQRKMGICLYTPASDESADEDGAFTFRLYADVCEKLKDYRLSLVVIRHNGGLITMVRFDQLWHILTRTSALYDNEKSEEYFEIKSYPTHISVTGNPAGIKVGFTDLS